MKRKSIFLLIVTLLVAFSFDTSAQSLGEKIKEKMEKGAKATEKGIKKGVDATKKGVKKGAGATEKGIDKGVDGTKKGVDKANKAISSKSKKDS